jgi:uncharacterized protein (UPF0297 family)
MTEIEKEITLKAHEACKKHDSSAYYRYGYHDGAKWMYEKMQETNEGQALLYAVEKTAERTKREVIEKAAKWLSNNMFNSINNGVQINGYCVSDFIGRFKQAMQDESK